mmetsp:Transcript_14183/g.34478  ORF Transcript_14183/g.34478 Transcript_14183/m.34478 type:complete len:224 (-) Transcript_14183:452-1123(-)
MRELHSADLSAAVAQDTQAVMSGCRVSCAVSEVEHLLEEPGPRLHRVPPHHRLRIAAVQAQSSFVHHLHSGLRLVLDQLLRSSHHRPLGRPLPFECNHHVAESAEVPAEVHGHSVPLGLAGSGDGAGSQQRPTWAPVLDLQLQASHGECKERILPRRRDTFPRSPRPQEHSIMRIFESHPAHTRKSAHLPVPDHCAIQHNRQSSTSDAGRPAAAERGCSHRQP